VTPIDRFEPVAAIARALLYEGYVLWPYRRSALKNQRRWTFGGVHPRAWSEAGHPDDAWRMVTRCLVRGGPDARVEVRVRFLQVVRRGLERVVGGGRSAVDEIDLSGAGGERWLAWEEATEWRIDLGEHGLGELAAGGGVPREIEIPAGRQEDAIPGPDPEGEPAGWVVRTWHPLSVRVVLTAEAVPGTGGAHALQATIENRTPLPVPAHALDRQAAVGRSLISTHTVFAVDSTGDDARFVSLADPPSTLADAAEACRRACTGTWPVLAGEPEGAPGESPLLLSSPIILEDHPRIAPESPGDLFDGGEIDQLLVLNVLALTDEERDEMAASDPKAREILERCAALGPEEMRRLHGALREPRTVGPGRSAALGRDPRAFGPGRTAVPWESEP
jgi:hypothetical protein